MTERPSSPYTLFLDDYREEHRTRVGGKSASLGSMIGAGLPVPPGFTVTTEAYDTLRSHPDLRTTVHRHLDGIDHADTRRLSKATQEVRGFIEEVDVPEPVASAIGDAYDALCEEAGGHEVPVAVRSSATAEDLPDASFAGLQDTFLWITGRQQVLDHVKRCWSSVFTDRAVAYRRQRGYDHQVIDMGVAIQKMVVPQAAGVAFTLNPSDGDRSQVAIDAAWGFGESVVSGEVTPDNFLVDKVIFEIVDRNVGKKALEYRLNGSGIEVVPLDEERARQPCLTDEQIRAVARMARRTEKHYGCPQDVEWAVDSDLPEGEDVVLLQSRPETVWSRQTRPRTSHLGTDPMDAIVHTLCSPLSARQKQTS